VAPEILLSSPMPEPKGFCWRLKRKCCS